MIIFMSYNIEKLDINNYPKCNAIWDMQADPLTEKFRKEIESGNREVYICKGNGNFIGEIACVYDMNDPDYTISGQRIYLSRLIVKPNYRNKGIGGILIDFMIEKLKCDGYKEITVGVDKDNFAAIQLYRKKGFTKVLFNGGDEQGEYFKLLEKL